MRTRNTSGTLIVAVLCLAWTFVLGTASCGSPYFCLESETEWNEALMTGHIQPVAPYEWDDYMIQWDDHLEEGDPYPENEFRLHNLYVYGGGGGGFTDPEDAGLVMYWGAPPPADPPVTYSAAWRYRYWLDPNLSNSTITVTVTAPQFDPATNNQITTVSFGIQDAAGLIRAWHWKCGPGNPIRWSVPTQITINTALTGLNAANPTSAVIGV